MTEEYKFFDSTSDDIREYSAGDFANYWGSIYTSGLLFEQNTLALQVTTNGSLTTKVGSGKALIKGHAYENTESLIMVHNPSSGGRIDRVVLRMDLGFNQRYIRLFVKEGTASAPPSLTRTEQIYELSLAQVKVRAGASSITASDITDERLNEEVCGPVVALVAAMAFSYPSDVPGNITYIKDKIDQIYAHTNAMLPLVQNMQLDAYYANPFNRKIADSNQLKKVSASREAASVIKVIQGKCMLKGVTLVLKTGDAPGSSGTVAHATVNIDGSVYEGVYEDGISTSQTIELEELYINDSLVLKGYSILNSSITYKEKYTY